MLVGDYCYIKLQMLWSWFQISPFRQIKFRASDMSLWFILGAAIHQLLQHKSADPFSKEAICCRKLNCSKSISPSLYVATYWSMVARRQATTQPSCSGGEWLVCVKPLALSVAVPSQAATSQRRALTNYDKLAPHLITSEGKSQWCLLGVAS